MLAVTSALDVGGWLTPHPATLFPGMTQHQVYRRLGGPQGRFGRARKTRPLLGFDLRTVQPIATQTIGFEC
jgi:hypothetical protein